VKVEAPKAMPLKTTPLAEMKNMGLDYAMAHRMHQLEELDTQVSIEAANRMKEIADIFELAGVHIQPIDRYDAAKAYVMAEVEVYRDELFAMETGE
jgi:hypothetical protein